MDRNVQRPANPPRRLGAGPGSSSSRHSTQPSASTSTSTSTSTRADPGQSLNPTDRDVAPSSALLQDLLRERKAESRRSSSTNNQRSRAFDNVDARLIQSSPLVPGQRAGSQTQGRRGSSMATGGQAGAGGMGVREMEEYTSNLHKQNFDLKLELFHRRERTTALEKQLERQLEQTQQLESDNTELQEVNEQLLQELEKRDRAVEEAVGIICELEEKVERLEQDANPATPSMPPRADGSTKNSISTIPPSSPPPMPGNVAPQTPLLNKSTSKSSLSQAIPSRLIESTMPATVQTPARTPSFLTSEKNSAGALRSLYLAGEDERRGVFGRTPLSRYGSVVGPEQATPGSPRTISEGWNSPRLSVLSESSFLSVYGKIKPLDLDSQDDDVTVEDGEHHKDGNPRLRDQTSAERMERWMDNPVTPSKGSRSPSSSAERKDQYLSIGDVLQKPTRTSEAMSSRNSPQKSLENVQKRGRHPLHLESVSFGGPIFGQGLLPPTPDTMSTIDPDGFNGSKSSIVTEKSLLDGSLEPARSHGSLAPNGRPSTSNGVDGRGQSNKATSWDRHVNFADLASSDGELESTCADKGDWDAHVLGGNGSRNVPFVSKPWVMANPQTQWSGRDMMFNGEGIEELASRERRSDPSLRSGRRRSLQFPASEPRPSRPLRTEVPGASGRRAEIRATATPSKHPAGPSNSRRRAETSLNTPLLAPADQDNALVSSEPKLPRSSFSVRMAKMSLTPSPTKRGARFTARIFGRVGAGEPSQPSQPAPAPRRERSASRPTRPTGMVTRSNTAGSLSVTERRPGVASDFSDRWEPSMSRQHPAARAPGWK